MMRSRQRTRDWVATDRKPRPGLKPFSLYSTNSTSTRRDGPKTQTGIETQIAARSHQRTSRRDGPKTQTGIETAFVRLLEVDATGVATDRKPRPGLKQVEQGWEVLVASRRDGPKTQTGIETMGEGDTSARSYGSRRTENPDRD